MKWVYRFFVAVILFTAIFFLVPVVLGAYTSDPLGPSLRTQFNSIAHIGKKAERYIGTVRVKASPERLGGLEERYTKVADEFNALIDKAIDGVRVRRVDDAFLSRELAKLQTAAREFDVEIETMITVNYDRPSNDIPLQATRYLEDVIKFANASMTEWRKLVLKREELDQTVIEQLQHMRWLSWGAKRAHREVRPPGTLAAGCDRGFTNLLYEDLM